MLPGAAGEVPRHRRERSSHRQPLARAGARRGGSQGPARVQQVDVPGWTWAAPASSGSVIWATGDKGGVEAYALGDYASKTPLRLARPAQPRRLGIGPGLRAGRLGARALAGGRPIGQVRPRPGARGDRARARPWASWPRAGPAADRGTARRLRRSRIPRPAGRRSSAWIPLPARSPGDGPGRSLAHAPGAVPRTGGTRRASARPAQERRSRSSKLDAGGFVDAAAAAAGRSPDPVRSLICARRGRPGSRRDRAPGANRMSSGYTKPVSRDDWQQLELPWPAGRDAPGLGPAISWSPAPTAGPT